MKIVKITSLGCPSCIIMNKVFNKIKEKYDFEVEEYDIDFEHDKIEKFNINNKIPTFIFYKDGVEVERLVGEHKEEIFENIVKEYLWKNLN